MICYNYEINLWGILFLLQYAYGTYIVLYEISKIWQEHVLTIKEICEQSSLFLLLLIVILQIAIANLIVHDYEAFKESIMTMNGFMISSIMLAIIIEVVSSIESHRISEHNKNSE